MVTSTIVAKFFTEQWVVPHGIPKTVLTDNDQQFVSKFIDTLCLSLGMKNLTIRHLRWCWNLYRYPSPTTSSASALPEQYSTKVARRWTWPVSLAFWRDLFWRQLRWGCLHPRILCRWESHEHSNIFSRLAPGRLQKQYCGVQLTSGMPSRLKKALLRVVIWSMSVRP